MNLETEFKKKHRTELESLLERSRRQLLEEVVPFWEARIIDREYGGYFNFFDREGRRYDDRKPGWFAGRTLYTFSALCNGIGHRDKWIEIAEAGRRYMDTAFYAGNGRFNRMMDRKGAVLSGTDSIFTDHFAVKGLYEYIAACGSNRRQEDINFARMLTDQLFSNVESPEILTAEKIPPHLQKHAVTFMTLLVAQESRKIFGDTYNSVVDKYLQKALYVFANDEYHAPLEYAGTDGHPVFKGEGRLVDPGHSMESLWFSMQEGVESNRPELFRRAGQVLDWVIDRSYDEEFGGFYHIMDVCDIAPHEPFLTTYYGELPVSWNDKVWWVQAEGLVALAMSALLNENERHYSYFVKLYDYIDTFFRDREYGEWYSVLKRDGAMRDDHKGSEFKGPYHVPRCLLQLVLVLEDYLQ